MAMSSGGFVGALNIRVRQRSRGACWKSDSTVLSSTGRPREATARAKDPQGAQGAVRVHMVKPRPWDQPLDLVAKVLEISCEFHVIMCHDDIWWSWSLAKLSYESQTGVHMGRTGTLLYTILIINSRGSIGPIGQTQCVTSVASCAQVFRTCLLKHVKAAQVQFLGKNHSRHHYSQGNWRVRKSAHCLTRVWCCTTLSTKTKVTLQNSANCRLNSRKRKMPNMGTSTCDFNTIEVKSCVQWHPAFYRCAEVIWGLRSEHGCFSDVVQVQEQPGPKSKPKKCVRIKHGKPKLMPWHFNMLTVSMHGIYQHQQHVQLPCREDITTRSMPIPAPACG